MKIYSSAAAIVGSTPLVRLSGISEKLGLSTPIIAKLESANPTGSAKDRAALYMLNAAEEQGLIGEGAVIIESTSGNTGIALASLGTQRGYRVILTMPDTMSAERIKLLKAYGAEIVLTPGALGMNGAVEKANELAEKYPGSFIPNQFANSANADAHYNTTGPEIWEDTDGAVDILVACVGSGGTITGIGRYLKEHKPSVCVAAVQPERSPVLTGGEPGAHRIQGIGTNFIPEVLDMQLLDRVVSVGDDEAHEYMLMLARTEGILCGVSSGAALCAAVKLARCEENEGKMIVAVLPDTGERYLSLPEFE